VREGRGVELAKACLISAWRRNILVSNAMVLRAQPRAILLIVRVVYDSLHTFRAWADLVTRVSR
jgi:hypothetical protein